MVVYNQRSERTPLLADGRNVGDYGTHRVGRFEQYAKDRVGHGGTRSVGGRLSVGVYR